MFEHLASQGTRIPITILSGFLGAGKSTLLNHILRSDHGLRIAVLVNDFGSVSIDADLIVDVDGDGDIMSLANGCFCCTLRDDLVEAVSKVAARPERPDHVLLEASGVAQASGIALAFGRPSVSNSIRVDSILCVVDAEQLLDHPELMELKLGQVGCADLVIVNKIDLVSAAQLARVREWLTPANPTMIEAVRCDVPVDILLGGGRRDPARLTYGHPPDIFATCTFETDRPLSLARLRTELVRLPGLYRAKGFVHTSDSSVERILVQVVGQRLDISRHGEWHESRPQTRLVFIGRAGEFDPVALQHRMETCVAPLD